MATLFESHERLSPEAIRQQVDLFHNSLLQQVLDALPLAVVILNECRQLVYCNMAFRKQSSSTDLDRLLGLRMGEALGCIHKDLEPEGCGATEYCQHCGAANAILQSLRGRASTLECRLTRRVADREESLDLQAMFRPLAAGSETLLLGIVIDIGHEKRLQVVERLFFHDIINSIDAMQGLVDFLPAFCTPEAANYIDLLRLTSSRVTEVIQSQKDLLAAEHGALNLSSQVLNAFQFLEQLQKMAAHLTAAVGKQLILAPECANFIINTDATLLKRILDNMLKNAFEASAPGATVTLGARLANEGYEFWVRNPGVMAPEIQLQLFKRSFSTKGDGRGLGTYSMKLLGERYLGGRVGFRSYEAIGTEFFISLPHDATDDASGAESSPGA